MLFLIRELAVVAVQRISIDLLARSASAFTRSKCYYQSKSHGKNF